MVRPRISGALVLLASFLFIAAIAGAISATLFIKPNMTGVLGVSIYSNPSNTPSNSVANQTITHTSTSTVESTVITSNISAYSTSINTTATTSITPTLTGYMLSFGLDPNTGDIVFNNITYYNGNTAQVFTGNYQIDSVAPANFVFSNWSYTGNIIVINATEPNTIVSVLGNGTITANFNALTAFSENGLPSGAVWSVAYNGIVQNAIAPNSIVYSTFPGNYIFNLTNETVGSIIYTPKPQSDYLEAGDSIEVNFIPASNITVINSTVKAITHILSGNYSEYESLLSNLKAKTPIQNLKKNSLTGNSILEVLKVFEANSIKADLSRIPININFLNDTQSIYVRNVMIAYENRTESIKTANISLYSTLIGDRIVSYTSAIPSYAKVPIIIDPNTTVSSIIVESSSNESALTTNVSISLYPNNISDFKKQAYAEFKINSTLNDTNVINAEYNFSVNKNWIDKLGISPNQVTLYKLIKNNTWIQLPTSLIGSNLSNYYYTAESNSLSTYLVSYSTGGTGGDISPESVTLPNGYRLYLCGAGANYTFSTSGTAFTWTQDVGAPSGATINNGENASIGHQSSNVCSAYTTGASEPGLAVAGIGVNAIYYTLYSTDAASSTSVSLPYTVATSNSFVVLVGAAGYYNFTTINIPGNCIKQVRFNNIDTYETAYIATCQNAASGSYTFSADLSGSGSSALAAYVFSPSTVTLNDNPSTGTITTNGATYSNGQTMQVIGTNSITANPPATGNWVFNSWEVSNSINLTIANTLNPSTSLTVMGNGIVTATWNGISKFTETGLPSGATWNVIYNGALNSSSTNTILFSTLPGNYIFSVANQIVSGTTYTPTPSTGHLAAGNTQTITFSQASAPTCTISLAPNTINFGTVVPGSSVATINAVKDDNSGNTGAYILVYGGNWIGPSQFGVSNTVWDASNDIPFSNAFKLTTTPSNTAISVAAGSSNDVYFGLGVPGGAVSGLYSQAITIENSC